MDLSLCLHFIMPLISWMYIYRYIKISILPLYFLNTGGNNEISQGHEMRDFRRRIESFDFGQASLVDFSCEG